MKVVAQIGNEDLPRRIENVERRRRVRDKLLEILPKLNNDLRLNKVVVRDTAVKTAYPDGWLDIEDERPCEEDREEFWREDLEAILYGAVEKVGDLRPLIVWLYNRGGNLDTRKILMEKICKPYYRYSKIDFSIPKESNRDFA